MVCACSRSRTFKQINTKSNEKICDETKRIMFVHWVPKLFESLSPAKVLSWLYLAWTFASSENNFFLKTNKITSLRKFLSPIPNLRGKPCNFLRQRLYDHYNVI